MENTLFTGNAHHLTRSAVTSENIENVEKIVDVCNKIKSANYLKELFKKFMIAQSYGKMLFGVNSGTPFEPIIRSGETEIAPCEKKRKHPSEILNQFRKRSSEYLIQMRDVVGKLSPCEKELRGKVINADFHFKHKTRINLNPEETQADLNTKKGITLYSYDKLTERGMLPLHTKTIFTKKGDIERNLSGFVCCSLDVLSEKNERPAEPYSEGFLDYGPYAFVFPDNKHNNIFQYGFFTLFDIGENKRASSSWARPLDARTYSFKNTKQGLEMSEVIDEEAYAFQNSLLEMTSFIYDKKSELIRFHYYHMREVMALYLIHFLQYLEKKNNHRENNKQERIPEIDQFINYVMNPDLSDEDLCSVFNFVCTPEFHLAGMFHSKHYKKYQVRDLTFFIML